MHTYPRTGPIDKIVLHVNVGPEVQGGAAWLANYLDSIEGGYHLVIDNRVALRTATDDLVVYGATGMNARGLHLCFIGHATQTAAQWLDAYSRGELDLGTYEVARWCIRHGIPPIRLTVPQVATNGIKGLCSHKDVSDAYRGTHWDPGPNFPWPLFLDLVRHFIAGGAPANVGSDMPKPTDVVAGLENQWGRWHLTADGGVITKEGSFFGSYPGLPPARRQGDRYFVDIVNRPDGKKGYCLIANTGQEYNFP